MKPAKRNNIFLVIFILAFFSVSCENNNVTDENISKIYVELEIARVKNFENKDSLAKAKTEIFSKYKISEQEFTQAMKNFEYDEESWKEFFDSSKAYIDTLINKQVAEEEAKP